MAYTNWTDAEVFRLIQIWSEEGIQEQLEGAKRNKHVYEQLAEDLIIYGIEKTGEQCRTKVKKLRQEYKKLADKHKETGQGRTEWKFFDKLNEFLATRPATRPPVVLDTLDSTTLNNTDTESPAVVSDEEHELTGGHDDGNEEDQSNTSNEANDGTTIDATQSSAENVPSTDVQSTEKSTTSKCSSGRKRKRNKGEVMEDMMTKVMKSVTDSMQNSDRMFLELEERRMKFEAEQRRQEREFPLRMVQMFNASQRGHSSGYSCSYSPYFSPPPSEFYYGSDNS